jgi:hypothetical protein
MTVKFKTEELAGEVLDLLVSRCVGVDAVLSDPHPNGSRTCITFYGRDEESGHLDGRSFCPSGHWGDGGPIKESRGICSGRLEDGRFFAHLPSPATARPFYGHSELVAVMRCIVASEMGDEVEAPDLNFSHIDK